MKNPLHMLGFDFGASSGRAMHGAFDGKVLSIEETHRFPNDPVMIGKTLYWDALRLFFEMREGLLKAARKGITPASVGIDTWGVDFGLLDGQGELIGNPVHYRDTRTEGMIEHAERIAGRDVIFGHTGLAFLPFNTLYQLLAMKQARSEAYERARTLLFMPDLFAYFLTGEKLTEYTIASTAQLTDPRTRSWSEPMLDLFDLPRGLFSEIVEPGTLRGVIRDGFAEDAGIAKGIQVVSVAQHDTAAAVAAVPSPGGTFAYISSGTWSLLGVETDAPVISPGVLRANYTNEGGASLKTRVLKNIMGMWIIQECRRVWLMEGECEDFAGLASLADKEPAFSAFIDPDDERFLARGDMPARIREYCRQTGQHVPQTRGQMSRVIYESLALKYRWAIERLERDILGHAIDRVHIVGGGSNNALLNRMTADACGKPVIAGPGEATVIGNLLIQAMALSEIGSIGQLREVVRASFETTEHMPKERTKWDDAYGKFLSVTGLEG